ncbi:TonB-dependent receptor [Pedobacter antarcticus]|uniref:TonB-dependent receptor n=1 Tax=Pedobacter antarcticus TaxID=34086 RepID=UPI00292DE181|nr:TonB-dependent receptor [Pedobacter antarcticus]
MKLHLQFRKTILTLFGIFFSIGLFAQGNGKITGTVSDKKTGETLIGVTVKIKGTAKGLATDVDGKYALTGLSSGKLTLVFQYIGYTGKEISEVEVNAARNTVLNVVLEEASSQNLTEVVIKGSFKKESVNALYAQQKNSAVISDGISSDMIRRSPDRSTGDVLKRVSGTTIQDNKFVIVRGLSDRYNNATLDNSSLPSTEPNRKAFSFDIVPAGLIDNIVVSKTATPDLAADFAGGSIKIITKDIPDNNFFDVSIGGGYNSQSTFKDFYYGPRYTQNYFGFDGGERQLPVSKNFPKNTDATNALRGNSAAQITAINKLPKVWKIGEHNAPLSQNHQLSFGRVKEFENGGKLGAIVSLSYRNSETTRPEVQRQYYTYDYNDRVNTFSTNIGGMANFAYVKGKNKISFKNLYNRILEDKFTYRTGTDVGRSSDLEYYAFDMIQKGIFKTSLDGDHQLAERNKLSWTLSYANITNNQPDQRKIGYLRNVGLRDDPSAPFLAANTALTKENNRFFSDLNESLYGGAVNDQQIVSLWGKNATLKGGLGANYRKRDFAARLLGITLINANQEIQALPLSQLYSTSLINSGVYELSEITGNTDKYDANSLTSFAYVMLDQSITDKLRVVYGLRAEKFNLNLNSRAVTGEAIKVKQDYLDILPSLNLTYALTEKSNLRGSYYRTLARPEFRELAPFDYYDYELLGNVAGNTNLKRTLIDNADIRYEIYPAAGQIMSVSGFYKHFKNAIEPSIYDQNSTPAFSYFNTPSAVNYGVELELRHSLGFINEESALKNMVFYVNSTLVKSKVTNPTDQPYLVKDRPMVGQSPYSINAGLQYNALDNNLNFSLLYNRIGRRIANAGGQRFGDVYEAPRNVIDFQTSYSFYKKKAQIKFNVNDVLNNKAVFYFDYNQDKKYSPSNVITNPTTGAVTKDEILAMFKTGTNISLSVSYSF